jgi:hypothetical protein
MHWWKSPSLSNWKTPKINVIVPKRVKNRKKLQNEILWYFQLNEAFELSLTHDYIGLHQSLPAFISFDWHTLNTHTEIMEKYNWLLLLCEQLMTITNAFLSEQLDTVFNKTTMADPNDKDVDILVNQWKMMIEYRHHQLQTIIKSLQFDYLDNNQVNAHLLKAKEQKKFSNSLQRQVKDIYQDIWSLLVIFANEQLEWSREK